MAKRMQLDRKWRVVTQRGANLGERMRNAIEEQLHAGAEKVVIVGTDSPWMGRERIARALRLLDKAEVVIGPSEDGGYYLVAARKVIPKMFEGIRWGTSEVLPKTVKALRATRTKFRLLRSDFDLDRPEDLRRVARMAAGGRLQSSALKRWLRSKYLTSIAPTSRGDGTWATKSSRRREPNRPSKKRRPGRG
jgi:glycosyltransferase A (GT-A) superfamily protein (DUF2064 family)